MAPGAFALLHAVIACRYVEPWHVRTVNACRAREINFPTHSSLPDTSTSTAGSNNRVLCIASSLIMVDSGADAASGPYGPGNPPPPPSGPPPSTKERKRSRGNDTYLSPPQDSLPAKGPGRAFLHRKLNSRQRKHFRDQQAELVEQQDRGRSCSPPPREPQTSQERYRERSDMRRDNGREQPDSGWTTRKSRRKSLRDARRITPDQIMEQTPGRLSLPRAYGESDFYQDERAVLRSTKRTDWPDGRSSRPRSDAGKHVTGTRGPTSERSGGKNAP